MLIAGRALGRAIYFAKRFHAASPWRDAPLDEDAVEAFLIQLSEHGYLDVRENGMIGGLVNAPWFSPATPVATELFWWSEQKGLGRLLREGFEAWAREKGAVYLQFSGLADANEQGVRANYARNGFDAVEIGFRKAL